MGLGTGRTDGWNGPGHRMDRWNGSGHQVYRRLEWVWSPGGQTVGMGLVTGWSDGWNGSGHRVDMFVCLQYFVLLYMITDTGIQTDIRLEWVWSPGGQTAEMSLVTGWTDG